MSTREVTYHVWTDDEPAAGLQGEHADVRMFVAQPNDHVRAALAEAFAKVWCVQPQHVRVMPEEPPERTPETVLRAMLRAYEAAALRLGVATWSDPNDSTLSRRADTVSARIAPLRQALVYVLAQQGNPIICLGGKSFNGRDYEARLAGERDLNAPPLEE